MKYRYCYNKNIINIYCLKTKLIEMKFMKLELLLLMSKQLSINVELIIIQVFYL